MSKIKLAALAVWNLAREIFTQAPVFNRALILFAALGLATQLAVFSSYLYQNRNDRAIVGATDNDGGVAVAVALDTQIYSDNGWRPYGPVYYRLVRLAKTLVSDPAVLPDLSPDKAAVEVNERTHHFYLMLVSLFSMALLAYFLASLLTEDLFYRLLMTIGLVGAFNADPIWTEMIFRPHPDHIFSLILAFAFYRTWLWLRAPDDRTQLLYAGASWGLAAATKMTVLLFGFSVLLLLLPWRREKTPRQIGLFVGSAFLVYMIVGFPQSFNFGGVIQFLIEQKRNVLWGDLDFLQRWLHLFGSQAWRPLLVILGFSLFVPLRRDTTIAPRIAYLKLAVLALLPILSLWSRHILSPIEWYPLPFLAGLFVAIIILLIRSYAKLPSYDRVRESAWTKVAAFFVLPLLQPALSPQLPTRLAEEAKCRPEAAVVQKLVNAEAALGHHILVDPYIPYDRVYHDKEIEMAWEMHPERIQNKTTMIALRKAYYSIYLPVEEGGNGAVILHIRDMEKTRAFYRLFNTRPGQPELKVATDPLNQRWIKSHSDSCTYEIWTRDGAN